VAPRAVFDTNVLLSALFSVTGPPFRCLALSRTGAVESITCQPILDEFVEKLIEKFGFIPERAQEAAQEICDLSTL
jgi:predicted nucleic acid-binding protein